MRPFRSSFSFASRLSLLSSSVSSFPHSDFIPPSFFSNSYQTLLTRPQIHQYSRSYGNLQLCERIANVYSEKMNKNINLASEVLVCAGSNAGFFNIVQSLVEDGDEVVIEGPTWDGERRVVEVNGGVLKEFGRGDRGLELDKLLFF
jgi:aspartate/methionine/tyrosine aminotransferase